MHFFDESPQRLKKNSDDAHKAYAALLKNSENGIDAELFLKLTERTVVSDAVYQENSRMIYAMCKTTFESFT